MKDIPVLIELQDKETDALPRPSQMRPKVLVLRTIQSYQFSEPLLYLLLLDVIP